MVFKITLWDLNSVYSVYIFGIYFVLAFYRHRGELTNFSFVCVRFTLQEGKQVWDK